MVLFTIKVVSCIKHELNFIVINSFNNILESAVKWGVCRGWKAGVRWLCCGSLKEARKREREKERKTERKTEREREKRLSG